MERKPTIFSLWGALFLLGSLLVAKAADPATLRVNIEPRVSLEAPSSVVWGNAGDAQFLEIPLAIKVRLNRGTSADLSISRTDSIPVLQPDSVAGGPPRLEVEGSGGIADLSEAAVVLQRFSPSGVYHHSVILRLPAPPPSGSYLIPLLLRLSASDGAAASLVPLTVRLERP